LSLRIHGGEARGRRLRSPAGIRPTQGLVVEAIFNMLGPDLPGALVVDLFAGSGALGLEALSRGAAQVTFVERDQACASILRQNLSSLAYDGRARTVRAEVVRWLEANPDQVAAASVILLDPPYRDPVLEAVLERLDGLAGSGALVVAEHAARQDLPELRRLQILRHRRYGDTALSVLRAA
jgi:16S rRNA (guanine966-N2)-methyltransferase